VAQAVSTLREDTSTKPRVSDSADSETANILRSPLRHIDAETVSAQVRREVRNREIHLPPISTYRWWARRTEAVNGSIIDAVASDRPGRMVVSDPFAGGGVIPLAAIMRGHSVYAQDLNPWAAAGLASMLALPEPESLRDGIAALTQKVLASAEAAYGTTLQDETPGLVTHTFRVAVAPCTRCGARQRIFPHALVSLTSRVEKGFAEAFVACPNGHLFKGQRGEVTDCPDCGARTDPEKIYTPRRIVTCSCGHEDRLEARASASGLDWEVVLVERVGGRRRELAIPSEGEQKAAAALHLRPRMSLGEIPMGQETAVLLRHGFAHWEDLYPRRQRAMVERLLKLAPSCSTDETVTAALKLAIVGSTEMAGHLSRWDRYYLKSYESMAGHRFNFTTLAAEPNVWGTANNGRGTTLRRLVQLVKAAEWLREKTGKRLQVEGPLDAKASSGVPALLGDDIDGRPLERPDALVVEGSSQRQLLPTGSVDLVLTDPPYHDDVHYGELSRPLQAWAGLAPPDSDGDAVVNRATGQLTAAGSYTALLTSIFRESARLLSDDGHLIFSYANREPRAWVELLEALQSAGLRAVGCAVVHSENETDHAKRNVRACTLDLLLDLAPLSNRPVQIYRPKFSDSPEQTFLSIVADYMLAVGNLPPGWQSQFLQAASKAEFLQSPTRKATSA
jgi:putative DNA methylase